MAETQKPMNSKDAGNATGFSLSQPHDLGVSDVQDASLKIKHEEFFKDLDLLIGKGRFQGGCSIGNFMDELDPTVKEKLEEVMKNENVQSTRLADLLNKYGLKISSTDVLRRHRRRLQGRDGCMCYRESR
jgi:hypothetical protein